MHTIKFELEKEEFAAVERLAKKLEVEVEDIAYAGLNEFMQRQSGAIAAKKIPSAKAGRKNSLPKWADAPREVHVYESKA